MSTIGDVSAAASADVRSGVSISVAKTALDQARQQGGEVVELLKDAGRVQQATTASVQGVRPGELDVTA